VEAASGPVYDVPVMFSPPELEFLRSQRLCRLATVGPTGWPHVVPVMYALTEDGAFEFDADGVKLRNLSAEPRCALVVDGSAPKRGVTVQGRAEVIGHERARLVPARKFSWGL
jgi:nitroimidazol reductase NimA-like FMN-containing flavoprotein (pyridoxamine 5'-phosphate oxidase superfamily)